MCQNRRRRFRTAQQPLPQRRILKLSRWWTRRQHRLTTRDVSHFDALTLLDVANWFDGNRHDIAAFDTVVSEQLLKEGGLVITGFPGAADIDDLGATMLQFFNLPNEEKTAFVLEEPSQQPSLVTFRT